MARQQGTGGAATKQKVYRRKYNGSFGPSQPSKTAFSPQSPAPNIQLGLGIYRPPKRQLGIQRIKRVTKLREPGIVSRVRLDTSQVQDRRGEGGLGRLVLSLGRLAAAAPLRAANAPFMLLGPSPEQRRARQALLGDIPSPGFYRVQHSVGNAVRDRLRGYGGK